MVDYDQSGDTRGLATAGALAAVATVARYESILLDPIYTGRAMDRLIGLIADGQQFKRDENILFLHTGGSVGLFGCMTRIDEFLLHESCGGPRNSGVGARR